MQGDPTPTQISTLIQTVTAGTAVVVLVGRFFGCELPPKLVAISHLSTEQLTVLTGASLAFLRPAQQLAVELGGVFAAVPDYFKAKPDKTAEAVAALEKRIESLEAAKLPQPTILP